MAETGRRVYEDEVKDPGPSGPRARSRTVWYLVASVIVLIATSAVVLLLWLPNWILAEVERQALLRGVRLQGCALDYERGGIAEISSIELENCQVEFTGGLPGNGTIERMHVGLTDHLPTKVVVSGAVLNVKGELDWAGAQEQLDAVSRETFVLLGERNSVSWFSDPKLEPTIVLSELGRRSESDPWTAAVRVVDLLEGTASANETFTLRLHIKEQPTNYALVTVDPRNLRAQLTAQLERLPLVTLAGTLFQNIPNELLQTLVDARFEFSVPFGLNTETPKGRFDLVLHGLNFPVPRELAGLVHDQAPQLSGTLTSNRSYTLFDVPSVIFETGTLRMKGKARVKRDELTTHWTATMKGSLSCSAIVASAARVHLDSQLARVARKISAKALNGGVTVFVAIDADSRDLAAATVAKTVGVGCGLQAMPLTDLLSLPMDLIKEFPELADRIGRATNSNGPPKLPELEFPDLKKLPRLEIPGMTVPNTRKPTQRQ